MAWMRRIPVALVAFAFLANALHAQEPASDTAPLKGAVTVQMLPPESLGCGNSCGFYTGASLYLLKPYFGGNTAYVTNTGFGTASPTQTTTDFSWDYSASPAVWLGWTSGDGLGVRGRFFYFNQNSQTANTSLSLADSNNGVTINPPSGLPAPPGAGAFGAPGSLLIISGLGKDNLSFVSSLRLYTADIEATWMGQSGNWSWIVAGGGRYLQLAQNYNGTLNNSISAAQGGPATETQTLNLGHDFNGFGPTLNFRGDYRIGSTGLSLFGDVRGSFLVGSARESTNFSSVIADPNDVVGGSRQTSYAVGGTRDMTMPVLEIELGVAYTFMLGHVQTFVSAGAVNQTYFDAGSASQTSGNLSLFGGRFSLGLKF